LHTESTNPQTGKGIHPDENRILNFIKTTNWAIPLIALGILIVVFSLKQINNPDIGFHLKGGEWIIDNLKFPDKDVFTYTSTSKDYIDMQWLYQVMMYTVQSLAGYTGMTIFNVLLILTAFYLLYRLMLYRNVPLPIIILTSFLVLITIQIRFSYRPELLTWIGILITLSILEIYYSSQKKNLYWLPIISVLWVNMHGLFMIGLFTMGVYWISVLIRDKKPDLYFLKWFLIAIAATLINPYFITGATYPFYLLTRLDESNIFAQTISELQSPFSMMESSFVLELNLYFYTAIVSFLLMLVTFKTRRIYEYIIFAAFFYISYAAFRNVPIFMFYAGYMIAISLKDISQIDGVRNVIQKIRPGFNILQYAAAVIFILISARVVTGNYYNNYGGGIDFGVGLNQKSYPVKALEHMMASNLHGSVLNDIDSGGWIEWAFPGQVYIDGRLEVIGEELYKEYLNSLNTGQLVNLVNKYDPRFVVFNHSKAYSWIDQMNGLKDYMIFYLDENSIVYGKIDLVRVLPRNKLSQIFPLYDFKKEFTDDEIKKLLEIQPGYDTGDWFKSFYKSYPQYREMMNLAILTLGLQSYKEAEYIYLNVLEKTNGKLEEPLLRDLYFNLGTLYQLEGKMDNAKICYEKYLIIDPANEQIRARLNDLQHQHNSK
jgi:hypothetical protein